MATSQQLSKSDILDIRQSCLYDKKKFALTFFKERFYNEFSIIHNKIFEGLDACTPRYSTVLGKWTTDCQLLVIKAPRGVGKTSILTVDDVHDYVYRLTNMQVMVSARSDLAIKDSEARKKELTRNRAIKSVFGDLRPESRADDFSKERWTTAPVLDAQGNIARIGTMILPISWKQSPRGENNEGRRPDKITVDDSEDSKEVLSDDMREKQYEWFMSDLRGCVQKSEKRGRDEFPYRIIVVGTLLHQNSLIERLCADPAWTALELSLCDDNFHSNYPDFVTDEGIQTALREYREAGKLDIFYQEYVGMPASPESKLFRQDYFQYYTPEDLSSRVLQSIVLVDPAKTSESQNCDTAIVGWSYDYAANLLYLRDIEYGKFDPETTINKACSMAARINAVSIGVEETGLNDYIKQPFTSRMLALGYNFELVWLKAQGKKDDRIMSLLPYFKAGHVRLLQTVSAPLEMQLLSMPRSKRKDVADAASYVVQMLERGSRHFHSISDLKGADFETDYSQLSGSYLPPINARMGDIDAF